MRDSDYMKELQAKIKSIQTDLNRVERKVIDIVDSFDKTTIIDKDADRQGKIDVVIAALDALKKAYPDTKIYIETPKGVQECKLGDALIYDTPEHSIAIDSE